MDEENLKTPPLMLSDDSSSENEGEYYKVKKESSKLKLLTIEDKLDHIVNVLENQNKRLDVMKKDIDDIKNIGVKNEENNKIMREHINFIERVYEQVSAPLNWACEKFNRTVGYNIYANAVEY